MDPKTIADSAAKLAVEASNLAGKAAEIAKGASQIVTQQAQASGEPFLFLFTVFVLAVFIGFYVVWSVTPALHSPLMSVTNAISSVIIVGGLIAAGPGGYDFSKVMGFIAIVLASVNIFGGFIVSQRMLSMFKKKEKN
ncbi:MAG: NAD(P) transhydrogenase subunit alpha [Rhodospirillales bacterium]|jgi:H+-translocating NAD(P) transhydrogenase subunit alpha